MSLDPHGVICYGIKFPGNYIFPWDDLPDQAWWESVGGQGECPLNTCWCGNRYWDIIVYLKDTCIEASENYPESFNPIHFKLKTSIIKIFEQIGLDVFDGPKWWLIARIW